MKLIKLKKKINYIQSNLFKINKLYKINLYKIKN